MGAWTKRVATSLACCVGLVAHAAPQKLFLEAGVIVENVGRYSTSSSGSTSLIGAYFFDLGLSYAFHFSSRWSFVPTAAYTLLGKTGPDGEKSTLLPLSLKFLYQADPLFFHVGPGLLISSISGPGGTKTLSNGTGTAVFALPSEKRSAQVVTLVVGAGIKVGESTRLGVDAMITNLLSKNRRSYNLMLNLGYGIL